LILDHKKITMKFIKAILISRKLMHREQPLGDSGTHKIFESLKEAEGY